MWLTLAGAILTAAAAQPVAAPAVDSAKVTGLVALLRSPAFRIREKAGHDLLALGDRALPALKRTLPSVEDPESSCRLQAVIAKLDASRLRAARRVTLKATDQSPKQILAEIARQTGYTIRSDDGGPKKTRLTFDLTDVPFWVAVDKVCDAAGLTVSEQGEDGSLAVYYTDTFNPHVCYDGPFKVVATNVNSGRALQLAALNRRQPNPREPEYLNLNLSVLSEPKAPVVGIGASVLVKAIDNHGNSLLPPADRVGGPHESQYTPAAVGFRSFNTSFGLSLVKPDRKAESIKELHGKQPVLLLAEARPEIAVPDPLSVKKKTFRGRTVDLDVIAADFRNNLLTLDLSFRKRGGDPDDYTWLNTLALRVEVLDAAGGKLRFGGVTSQTTGPGTCGMQLQFTTEGGATKAGKPATLQFVEWLTVAQDVNFVLKDVPLP